jgi:hypothetical protein
MSVVYEVTLEFDTKLFRQEIKAFVGSQEVVHELRDRDKQRRVGYRFASVRGPIAVWDSPEQVLDLIIAEREASNAVAEGR